MTNQWVVDEWAGCYPSNWKGSVVADAMTHPAKFSSRLIRRIYEHLLEEGWVKAGDGVVDPFGGVALGALDAMRLGLHWTGVELEERFFKIGNENIALWNGRFGSMPRWGTARLVHGDSRRLCQVIRCQVSGAVSSPPYGEQQDPSGGIAATWAGKGNYPVDASVIRTTGRKNQGYIDQGESDGQLAKMQAGGFQQAISSPPFLQSEGGTPEPKAGGVIDARLYERHAAGNAAAHGYGKSEGQLSSMSGEGFELAVSSPPFKDSLSRDNVTAGRVQMAREMGLTNSEHVSPIDMEKAGMRTQEYGETAGQLSSMSGDGFELAVSSPPFNENSKNVTHGETKGFHSYDGNESKNRMKRDYILPETDGNLGSTIDDDFWMAARAIVEEVYAALEPGGHASWVVKDYVKNKQVVPFADQWRQLCEAVGFVTLHEHRAMLVHHKGRQATLDGGVHEIKTESKSFFRRLAEKKGSPRIDWETVWCMVKITPSGADAPPPPNPAGLGEE